MILFLVLLLVMPMDMMQMMMQMKAAMPKAKELSLADLMPVSVEELRYQMDSGEFDAMMKERKKKKQKQKEETAERVLGNATDMDTIKRNMKPRMHDNVFRPR